MSGEEVSHKLGAEQYNKIDKPIHPHIDASPMADRMMMSAEDIMIVGRRICWE